MNQSHNTHNKHCSTQIKQFLQKKKIKSFHLFTSFGIKKKQLKPASGTEGF